MVDEYTMEEQMKGAIFMSTLPVNINLEVLNYPNSSIVYPQVSGLRNMRIQRHINQIILQHVIQLINSQQEQQGAPVFDQMIGTFEIKNNSRNILSLTLTNYAYAKHHANGLTLMASLTFDITNAEVYRLQDLFKPGSPYVERLSAMVKNQINERNIPVLNSFTQISPNQPYYIADKTLVLYFQTFELSPHYVGIPMFPISIYALEDIIAKDGPLERMLASF